ncbi:hypothetical protein L208DRAFT_1419561 [Tricholoma matsutake]|nr:hypothetical protein L208DRAFT_1419561 [Tricholoma matsutake 945]
MKFSQSLVFFVTAALTIPSTLAHFHVSIQTWADGTEHIVAIPSDSFGKCFGNDFRTIEDSSTLPSSSMTVLNLCGTSRIIIIKNPDDETWASYFDGVTEALGTCYPNVAEYGCSLGTRNVSVSDRLVCYANAVC